MNILFLATFPFCGAGGVGRVTETLAAEFVDRGHGCIFLSTSPMDDGERESGRQSYLPSKSTTAAANVDTLLQLVKKNDIDIIINQAGANTDVLDLVKSVADKCAVYTVHHNCIACLHGNHNSIVNHTFDRLGIPSLLRQPIVYRLLKERSLRKIGKAFERAARESKRLVLLADSFIDELSVFPNRIDLSTVVAIPNPAPFPPDSGALSEKENVLLFVGRLANGQKRVDRLLDIWAAVAPAHSTWRLDIVGDGPDREALQEQVRKMRLERITFHGKQNPVPFYRKARILLMTSDFEGFPMVLLEAQAFGCVPVAFDCFSAIREIIEDTKSGLVISQGDENLFSNVLSHLMENQEQLVAMSQTALEASRKFSKERIVDRWLNAIDECR